MPERSAPLQAGEVTQLALVVRNDGDLAAPMARLVDLFPAGWTVTAASVSKGLVSVEPGRVTASLGRMQPGEQIILTVLLQAPRTADSNAQHCITLDQGQQAVRQTCAPLPQVMASGAVAERIASQITTALPGPKPKLSVLSDIAHGQGGETRGGSLLVGNEGDAPLLQVSLFVELANNWRLSDVSTTLGLVSAVDYSRLVSHGALIRIGRLEPGALVAVTVWGWPVDDQPAAFCATLASDDQALQRVCDSLTLDDATQRVLTPKLALMP